MPAQPPERDLARITLSILGVLLLIVGSLWVLRPFLPALLWATMIVISTWPIMRGLQARLGGRRWAAVTVITTALLLVLFVPLTLAVATIVGEVDRLTELVHALQDMQVPAPPDWLSALPLVGERAAAGWREIASMSHEELATRVTPYVATAVGWFASKAGGLGAMLVEFLLTVAISAILYAKGESAADRVRQFFGRLSGERGEAIVDLAGKAVRAVALGIVVTAAVQTALAAVGLFGVGVPFAGFIAAVVLVLCIAQLGPLLPLVPCVIWLYATGSPVRGTILLVVTVMAQVIDNVLRPVLIKRGADLSLLLILPGVIGGLLWLGIVGLFVGPVVLAVTANLLDGWMTEGLSPAARATGGGNPSGKGT